MRGRERRDAGARGAAAPEAGAGPRLRGKVEIDWARCTLSGACAEACPTPALRLEDDRAARRARLVLDLGQCVFCGLCEEACGEGAVRLGPLFELAARRREDLVETGSFRPEWERSPGFAASPAVASEGSELRRRVLARLGRSLHVRTVDAGSCNGCEREVAATRNPVHDLTRYGIDFVLSPRHADLLLVTGVVTPEMKGPLLAARDAMPEPRLVVAVGACAIGGGLFAAPAAAGRSPAVPSAPVSTAAAALPVDVFVPGCPPRPEAILHGLRLAVDRVPQRQQGVAWRGGYPAAPTPPERA